MLCICSEYEHLLPVKDLDGVRHNSRCKIAKFLFSAKMWLWNLMSYHKGNYSSGDPKGTRCVKFLKIYSKKSS